MTADPTLFDGAELRDRGVALVDAVEPEDWKDRCDNAIAQLAASGRDFTAEDARAIAGDPEHYNSVGGRFLKASKAGLIVNVGVRTAERPSLHAHKLLVWRGVGS